MRSLFLRYNITNFLASAWVVLVVAFFVHLAMYSIRHAFGVFFKSFEIEFEMSRALTSGIFSVYMLLCAALGYFGGWALDKYGPQKSTLVMGVMVMLGLVLTSQATSAWQLFFTYSLLMALGTGSGHTVIMSTVSRSFHHHRGLAVGIASSGGGLGIFLVAPLCAYLITQYDWRFATIVIGISAGIIIIVLSQLLRVPPPVEKPSTTYIDVERNTRSKEPGNEYFTGYSFREVIRSSSFWLVCIAYLLQASAIYMINTHVVPHSIDKGFPAFEAAVILSIIGVGNVVGRVLAGLTSDSVGARSTSILCSFVGAGALAMLILSADRAVFYIFALLFGLAWGGFGTTVTVLVGRLFGLRNIGKVLGSMNVGWHLGAAIGPALGGIVFDVTDNYTISFTIGTVSLLTAGILTYLISPGTRRV